MIRLQTSSDWMREAKRKEDTPGINREPDGTEGGSRDESRTLEGTDAEAHGEPVGVDEPPREPLDPQRVPTLVMLWNKYEPDRIGECAQLYVQQPHVLGRLDHRNNTLRTLRFDRWRPSNILEGGALEDSRFSRQMLLCTPAENHGLRLEVAAPEAPLKVNGVVCAKCTVNEGALIQWSNKLLLLYQLRPLVEENEEEDDGDWTFGFGEADAAGLIGESAALWKVRHSRRPEASGKPCLLPPLGERREDIPFLLRAVVRRHIRSGAQAATGMPWSKTLGWVEEPIELEALNLFLAHPPASAEGLEQQVKAVLSKNPELPIKAATWLEVLTKPSPGVLWLDELSPDLSNCLCLLREYHFNVEAVGKDVRFPGKHTRAHKLQQALFALALVKCGDEVDAAALLLVGDPNSVTLDKVKAKLLGAKSKRR